MTVTPQTNTTLEAIAEALLAGDDICICGHVSPDGDCIGSQLALRLALLDLGKRVTVLLVKDDPLSDEFEFLPGSESFVYAGDFSGVCDIFVCVDVPNEDRMLAAASSIKRNARLTVTIDHHAVPKRMSDLSYTDPDSASTTMLIWKLIKLMGVSPTKTIATCAYSGLVTDTGRFQHQNTDSEVFKLAFEMVSAGADPAYVSEQFFQRRSVASLKLEAMAIEHMKLICNDRAVISWVSSRDIKDAGAVKADCEPLINILRSIDGVCVAAMLREEETGVRGSFRAKDDTDVAALAQKLGGGGHRAAAGFTLHEPLDKALMKVEHMLSVALARSAQ